MRSPVTTSTRNFAMLLPLPPAERAARPGLERHLIARGEEDRRLRFGVALADQGIRAYVARIEFARGLASAVTSDAQNVYIALTARGIVPNIPIVARASEEDAESKLLRAGATTVISPYSYAGQRMARVMTRPHVQRFLDIALSSLSETSLEIEDARVENPSKLVGQSLESANIHHRLGLIVLAIRRQDGQLDFNPQPSATVSAGDYLIVMGDSQNLKELESLAGV